MRYSSFLDWIEETSRQISQGGIIDQVVVDPDNSTAFEDDCFDSMKRLSQALATNSSVEHLILRNIVIQKKGGRWLRDTLRSNRAILSLHLEDTTTVTGGDDDTSGRDMGAVVTGIAKALQHNRTLQRLHLKSNQISDSSGLGRMLSKNNSLLELRICHNSICPKAARAICEGLKDNMALHVLDLTGNSINDKAVAEICRGLHHHSSVQFLCLDFNCFGSAGVAAIGEMLANNTMLQELHLFGNHIDHEGGRLLGRGLTRNIRLSTLILSFNDLGNVGASHLAEALVINSSLKKLWLPANHVGNSGLCAFAERLPQMKGLEQLNIGDYFDNDAVRALLHSIKFNMELRVLFMESVLYDDEWIERQIDYHVRLNKAGRKLLREPCFPTAMWPRVLERAITHSSDDCPDILYYMLREKPDLIAWRQEHKKH